MNTTKYRHYQSDFVRRNVEQGRAEGEVKGRAEGRADGLFAVLATRGIEVSDEARARIDACTDVDLLEEWIRRAVTASSIDDVLD